MSRSDRRGPVRNLAVPAARLRQELARFGHEAFRPGQEEAIGGVLAGGDVLAVFPTGSGKSLVYQLASQLLEGVTVVVSPLIALMQDQVDALRELGIATGAVSSAHGEAALAEAEAGRLQLLYTTPEHFAQDAFVHRLRRLGTSLLTVDEAHCIAEWGHDFRPAYLALERAAERLGRPPVLALT